MRKLSKEHRFQAHSLPEILHRFSMAVLDISQSVRFDGHKLKVGPAINAVIVDWLNRPYPEQEAAMRRGVVAVEKMMEGDDPPPAPRNYPRTLDLDVESKLDDKPSPKRRKKGG